MTSTKPGSGTESLSAPPENRESLGLGFAWTIVELAPDGILVSDEDGVILMANRHVEALFGYDRDALVGAKVERLLPNGVRLAHQAHRDGYVATPTTRPMGAGLDLLGCHADGTEFPIEISLSPVNTGHSVAIVVVIRDVSEQRARERNARETLASDEEDRIGAVMHDRVIGHLFGSGLNLAAVLSSKQLDESMSGRLHEVIADLDTAIYEIRNAIFQRMDPTPDSLHTP